MLTLHVAGALFLMNPYNNKLYKNFEKLDWVFMLASNMAILSFLVWFLRILTRITVGRRAENRPG